MGISVAWMNLVSEKFEHRYLKYAGHLAFALMTVFAGVFYLQRMLFVDPAFISYSILEKGGYAIQVYRFGVVITQTVPLLAHKLGASLDTILFLYSLCFPIFYWIIYSFLVHGLKAERTGFVLLLIFTLMANNSFFWVVAEYHQGMAMLVLFWAWVRFSFLLKNNAPGFKVVTSQILFAGFILFYHPLIIFPLLYTLIFVYLDLSNKKNIKFWTLLISCIVIFILKTIFFPNPYDDNKLNEAYNGVFNFFVNGNWGYFLKFIKFCFSEYIFFTTSCILIFSFYMVQRKFKRLTIIFSLITVYISLICLTYPVETPKVYMDGVFFALGFMVAIPLIYDILPFADNYYYKKITVLFLLILLSVRLPIIIMHHQPYTKRLEWIADLVAVLQKHQESDRFFINRDKIPMDKLIYDWGIFYETLLYSSLKNPEKARVATAIPNPAILSWNHANKIINEKIPKWIHSPWGSVSIYQAYYKRYSKLGKHTYKRLPDDEIPK